MPVPDNLVDFYPLVRQVRPGRANANDGGEERLTSDSEANKVSSEDESLKSAIQSSSVCSDTSETSLPSDVED